MCEKDILALWKTWKAQIHKSKVKNRFRNWSSYGKNNSTDNHKNNGNMN